MSSVSKVLSINWNRYNFDYIPNRDLWLNRLYFEISNSNKKDCLTTDCCNFNSIGSLKDRTSAESDKPQICCYNQNKKDKLFNKFLLMRKQSAGDNFVFEIENIVEEANNVDILYYKVTNELIKFNKDS